LYRYRLLTQGELKMKGYCMTLVRLEDGSPVDIAHTHVEAKDQEHAMLELLALCVKENVPVVGCRVVIAADFEIPAGLATYTELARIANHGATTAPADPPSFLAPGSGHIH
jgi:hypothetical protein